MMQSVTMKRNKTTTQVRFKPSPCPDTFSYEDSDADNDRWYGDITLKINRTVEGASFRLTLDRPSELLVSWIGPISTTDNKVYIGHYNDATLYRGSTYKVRIMVKFYKSKAVPMLQTIHLNGVRICPLDPMVLQSTGGPQTGATRPESFTTASTDIISDIDKKTSTLKTTTRARPNTSNNVNKKGTTYRPIKSGGIQRGSQSNNNPNRGTNKGSIPNYNPNEGNMDDGFYSNGNRPTHSSNQYGGGINHNGNVGGGAINSNQGDDVRTFGKGISDIDKSTSTLRTTTRARPHISNDVNNKGATHRPIQSGGTQGGSHSTYNPNGNSGDFTRGTSNSGNNNPDGDFNQGTNNGYKPNSGSRDFNQETNGGSNPNYNPNGGNMGGGFHEGNSNPNGNRSTHSSNQNGGGINHNGNVGGGAINSNQGGDGGTFGEDNAGSGSRVVPCGTVSIANPLITKGQITRHGQWPWHVALYKTEGINQNYICGGSLISKNKVITVAHCLVSNPGNKIVNPKSLLVYLGKCYRRQYSDETGVQTKNVIRLNINPSYSSSNFQGDIAILTLSSDAEFTNYVRPICTWEATNTIDDIIGEEGVIAGWGFTEYQEVSEELKTATLPVVSTETCLRSYPMFYANFLSNTAFCAGFQNGTSPCNGDSGGGLMFKRNNAWYLRGIVSLSVAKEGLNFCDPTNYVIFTDAARYVDFIRKSSNS